MKGRFTPSPTKKKMGAKNIGWANRQGVFRASSYSTTTVNPLTGEVYHGGSEYATLRFGNEYITVTKKVGEYMIEGYKQRIQQAKTKQEIEDINKFYKNYLKEKPGQVGVLLDNISKESGMGQLFKARLAGKLSPEMTSKFDDLASMISEINKDRTKAELFYADTQKAFKQVASKYKEMQEQGGYLDEFQMAELESALDTILQMAEQYTGRVPAHQMNISRY